MLELPDLPPPEWRPGGERQHGNSAELGPGPLGRNHQPPERAVLRRPVQADLASEPHQATGQIVPRREVEHGQRRPFRIAEHDPRSLSGYRAGLHVKRDRHRPGPTIRQRPLSRDRRDISRGQEALPSGANAPDKISSRSPSWRASKVSDAVTIPPSSTIRSIPDSTWARRWLGRQRQPRTLVVSRVQA